jgi:hypothetical protein
MTTQIMDTLKEEAKALKIKGWHIMGEDRLIEEIQKAKVVAVEPAEPVRKKAPRMKIRTARTNDRQALLDELNAKDPEYEHQYRMAGTPVDRIEAGGFEVVAGVTRGDEIVVRTSKDSFLEYLDASNDAEAKKMEAGVDDTGRMVQRQTSSPKEHLKEN